MSNEAWAGLLMGLLALTLPLSSLLARKVPLGQTVRYAIGWAGIFALGLVLFSFKDEVGAGWKALSARISPSEPRVSGQTVRIRQGEDGHFSVNATVNGNKVLFLIDTGATTTTMSRTVAGDTGVETDTAGFPVMVETANGLSEMQRARIEQLKIGSIAVADHPILIADQDGLNVIGMNFLDELQSWRVEGKEMILTP